MDNPKSLLIYTDGACKGNPGPGGWAAALIWGERIREISGGEERTTNNRMELTAVIKGLEALTRSMPVEVFSDSTYVVKGISAWLPAWKARGWRKLDKKPVLNEDLWRRLDELNQRHQVTWRLVKGHSGVEWNDRVDKLATEAIPKRA